MPQQTHLEIAKELPEELEHELIDLKDNCWCTNYILNGKNIDAYRTRVEEFHKKGFNVNIFLSVANNLERKLNGDNSHKGVTIKENAISEKEKDRNGLVTIKEYGLMLPQESQMGFKIYLGRNKMDQSEIIELWVSEKTGKYIEIKYTNETEDASYKRLFNQRDKLLRRARI